MESQNHQSSIIHHTVKREPESGGAYYVSSKALHAVTRLTPKNSQYTQKWEHSARLVKLGSSTFLTISANHQP